jgi:hypothetical protein
VLRLLAVELGLTFADDWLVVPVDLPAGSLARVVSHVVTDTFGARELGRRARRWCVASRRARRRRSRRAGGRRARRPSSRSARTSSSASRGHDVGRRVRVAGVECARRGTSCASSAPRCRTAQRAVGRAVTTLNNLRPRDYRRSGRYYHPKDHRSRIASTPKRGADLMYWAHAPRLDRCRRGRRRRKPATLSSLQR